MNKKYVILLVAITIIVSSKNMLGCFPPPEGRRRKVLPRKKRTKRRRAYGKTGEIRPQKIKEDWLAETATVKFFDESTGKKTWEIDKTKLDASIYGKGYKFYSTLKCYTINTMLFFVFDVPYAYPDEHDDLLSEVELPYCNIFNMHTGQVVESGILHDQMEMLNKNKNIIIKNIHKSKPVTLINTITGKKTKKGVYRPDSEEEQEENIERICEEVVVDGNSVRHEKEEASG